MDKCKQCSDYILDNNGLPDDAPEQIREHVQKCSDCSLKVELFRAGREKIEAQDYEIDSALLRAGETAEKIIKRRKDIMSFVFFIMTAGSVCTLIASAGKLGIVIPVLIVQAAMIFLMPAVFLVIFVKSRQKEVSNEQ